jgi:hypothetical protein
MRRFVRTLTAAAVLGSLLGWMPIRAVAAEAGLTGAVFEDLDRDGVQDGGEPGVADLLLYLFEGDTYLRNTRTSADGSYAFGPLADGAYRVEIAPLSWNPLRNDWVASSGTTLRPIAERTVPGAAPASLGIRRIVRSGDVNAPISSVQGANGTVVHSYNDAVPAQAVYDAILRGLTADEAPTVTVRFDLMTSDYLSYGGDGSGFRSTMNLTYLGWHDHGDMTLAHEYGHAWSLYYANSVIDDPTFSGYLSARGLTGDPRLGSTHGWEPAELIAEDYRQLFGSPTARVPRQENSEIPAAADVPGLRDYLRGPFMGAGAAAGSAVSVGDLRMSPAPVKASGTATFSLSANAVVTVRILDSKGTTVRTLVDAAAQSAGAWSLPWDRKNDRGQRVKTGTYVLLVTASTASATSTATSSFSVA